MRTSLPAVDVSPVRLPLVRHKGRVLNDDFETPSYPKLPMPVGKRVIERLARFRCVGSGQQPSASSNNSDLIFASGFKRSRPSPTTSMAVFAVSNRHFFGGLSFQGFRQRNVQVPTFLCVLFRAQPREKRHIKKFKKKVAQLCRSIYMLRPISDLSTLRIWLLDRSMNPAFFPLRKFLSLQLASAPVVGLVVSDITNPFFAEVVPAIEECLDVAGFTTLLGNASERLYQAGTLVEDNARVSSGRRSDLPLLRS
jgi:hypothetical protein